MIYMGNVTSAEIQNKKYWIDYDEWDFLKEWRKDAEIRLAKYLAEQRGIHTAKFADK